MLNVTEAFKENIKQLTVQSDGYVNIVNSSGTLTFNRDSITKIEIYGNAYQNDKVLGNLAQHSLTLELLGDYTKNISLTKENTVEVFLGVLVSGSYEYVQYQDFLITEITYSDTTNVTKIIATDNIVKLNKEYVDTNTYPMTLKSYLESVLTYCGLSLENTSFFNSTFTVSSAPFSDYTNCKEIIYRIAELSLSYVIVNKVSNKIELRSAFEKVPSINTHNILHAYTHDQLSVYTHNQLMYGFASDLDNASKDNYWSFKLDANNFGTNGINTLVLKISQVEGENNTVENATNVAIDGNLEISIVDNPFINTEALRLSVINSMFSEIDGYKYNPYSLEYRGFPYLELGDIIIVEQMNEEEVAVPIFETNIKWTGSLYGKITAKALSLTETKYRYISTTNQKIRNAEIMVDKANAEISLKVSQDEVVSAINLSPETIRINTSKLNIDAYVTFTNLSTSGQTTINGGNITTGTMSADRIYGGTINGNTVSVINLNAGNITAGTFSADRVVAGYLSAGTIGGWTINSSTISRNHITLGDDYISLGSATGTGAASINFHSGAAKLYNYGTSSRIGVDGSLDVSDKSFYRNGLQIVGGGLEVSGTSYWWFGGTRYILSRNSTTGAITATAV